MTTPIERMRALALNRMRYLDLSQRDVATRLGVSEKHVSQVLTGAASGSWDFWERLARVLRADWEIDLDPWELDMHRWVK